jgi:hypothetical protein
VLIVNGYAHAVPGREGSNYRQNPRLRLTDHRDWRERRKDEVVLSIVLHTRLGKQVILKEGAGPNRGWDRDYAARQSGDDRAASAHVAIDADGSYGCYADLAKIATYHASHMNGVSIGIECYQEPDGTVYAETLKGCADVVDVITRVFGIQRQFPYEREICRRFADIVPGNKYTFIAGANRGRDFSGLCGHRNITRNRGVGDPGDPIFGVLKERGYEGYWVDRGEDIAAWAQRQRELGMPEHEIDGVPEQLTRSKIMMARRGGAGLWVERPGDEEHEPDRPAGV